VQADVQADAAVYLCDATRTPFGRHGGALASVRTDDLAAIPLAALAARHPGIEWRDAEIWLGCANQAGEDNRNVARMAALLAGLPQETPALTVNRLCGSGLDAIAGAARAIRAGECALALAGGVESMSRAPYVMGKASQAYGRGQRLEDTTLGWRFVNPRMEAAYGVDSMAETAEHVAREHGIARADQDAYALRSQQRAARAAAEGRFEREITPVAVPRARGEGTIVDRDEQPRPETTLAALAALKPIARPDGTITAGNASGVNDGAAVVLLASADAVKRYGLQPIARVLGFAATGVAPRVMGIGPIGAVRKLVDRLGLELSRFDVIELNEAFAAQVLAVLRGLGLPDDAEHVNPNGGAIALGHPLGASGARLAATAAFELRRREARYALCTMCVGVGQGVALALERT
jgi:3-oxoadipyl-CoA thiolase